METKKTPSHLSLVPATTARRRRARFLCLVVDGGAGDDFELAELLEDEDLEVVTASNASEALRILYERSVDIVVAEEYLPGANGSHLLETVRARWPKVGRVLVGRELGPDVVLRAVNRARVQRVLYRRMSAQSLRSEIEAALNETLTERISDAGDRAAKQN
jgi:two-component system response regulator HupR/HoxA